MSTTFSDFRLKVQCDKSEFLRKIEFLGNLINHYGIERDRVRSFFIPDIKRSVNFRQILQLPRCYYGMGR